MKKSLKKEIEIFLARKGYRVLKWTYNPTVGWLIICQNDWIFPVVEVINEMLTAEEA